MPYDLPSVADATSVRSPAQLKLASYTSRSYRHARATRDHVDPSPLGLIVTFALLRLLALHKPFPLLGHEVLDVVERALHGQAFFQELTETRDDVIQDQAALDARQMPHTGGGNLSDRPVLVPQALQHLLLNPLRSTAWVEHGINHCLAHCAWIASPQHPLELFGISLPRCLILELPGSGPL